MRGGLGRQREQLSIQAHLAWCELKLRLKTKPNQQARKRLLDLLHHYRREGQFPHNQNQAGGRQPVFIDDHGTYCAVGYLMDRTGAADLAWDINRRRRFVYLETINLELEPRIKQWLATNELKPDEAALIQPTYGWDPFWSKPLTHTHAGMSGGDIVIAIASIVFSLLLLLPTISLIFLAKNTWTEKFVILLRRLGGLALLMAPPIAILISVRTDEYWGVIVAFVAVNIGVWVLLAGLMAIWLWRWWRGRPMLGFDETRNRYRRGMRFLFYATGAILLVGSLMIAKLAGPDYYIYLNLLTLVSLPLLLAHRPFQGLRPQFSRYITTGFLASILVLTFIIPSPIYTFDQLTRKNASCWPDQRSALSCWEISGGLPKLIQPNTWQDYAGGPLDLTPGLLNGF